jgi:hypothetical protein
MAIEISHVAPTKYLKVVDEFCKFHLVNGALIGVDKEYTDFFINSNKYKILNNGFVEGQPLNIHDLIISAQLINADEVVCPEMIISPELADCRMEDFWNACKGKFKVMVVPHGENATEWHESLGTSRELDKKYKINSVGLAASVLADAYKDITGMNATYPNRLEVLKNRRLRDTFYDLKWDIHLLGLSTRGGRELLESSLRPEIKRCSTSIAYQVSNEGGVLMYNDYDFVRVHKPVNYADEYDNEVAFRLRGSCQALNEIAKGITMNVE